MPCMFQVMTHSLDHLSILLHVSRCAIVMLLPFWYLKDGHTIVSGTATANMEVLELEGVVLRLLGSGIANTVQTISAFTFLSLVTGLFFVS